MNYFAFTARHEQKAAAELREAGYDAFAVMMMDRRRRHRHPVKGSAKTAKWEPRAVAALRGYVFCAEPSLWEIGKMRHVGQAVRFCGRFRPIPGAELERVLSARGSYFRDDDPPKLLLSRPAPTVRPGDTVRFRMAAETIDAPAMSTDGHSVVVKLQAMILGHDTMRVPMDMVEVVAS